ncbi:MAG: riboflavin synthase [Thermoanaerobaculia bacterium]
MFTGIVRQLGRVSEAPRPSGRGGVRLALAVPAELAAQLSIGASLAVAGVCLTVTELGVAGCAVEVSPETLRCTSLGALGAGDAVNLETPMKAGDPLGGHWVQGHVDGTAEVLARHEVGEHRVLRLAVPSGLAPYVVEKGSMSVDGVSLTVSARGEGWVEVALIPHTLAATTLGQVSPGDLVNLEADVLAKYVHQALAAAGRLDP